MITRTAYIKPNSRTQHEAEQSVSIVKRIMAQYNIPFDEWLNILFETGCLFVENRYRGHSYTRRLLTDEKHGFWASWMNSFIQDDALLLSDPQEFAGDYYTLKMQMANTWS